MRSWIWFQVSPVIGDSLLINLGRHQPFLSLFTSTLHEGTMSITAGKARHLSCKPMLTWVRWHLCRPSNNHQRPTHPTICRFQRRAHCLCFEQVNIPAVDRQPGHIYSVYSTYSRHQRREICPFWLLLRLRRRLRHCQGVGLLTEWIGSDQGRICYHIRPNQ